MAMAVRRRAVCALALLALLCGCGANAEGAQTTGDVNVSVHVSVEVSCSATGNELRWRVADKGDSTAWRECPQAVTGAGGIEGAAASNTLCLVAGSVYLDTSLTRSCPPSATDGDTNKVVAFTMNCTAAENSALHNLSRSENVTISPTDNPLGGSGGCDLPNSSQPATEAQSLPQQPPGQQQPAGTQQQQLPAPSAPVKTEHADNPPGGSRLVPNEPTDSAGLPVSASERRAQEPSAKGLQTTPTPSVGTAASPAQTADGAADAPGGTQTPSTPQDRSGTPNAAPAAGDNKGTTTTTTTTATTHSSSDGNDAKSNADGSATNSNTTQKAVANAADRSATSTLFVRAPLMLLLTAALACAAG
ncbi:putative mucin-like glycoprotein [Trypanosoma conorhini]|uniref:Putative mucin-like glycoprotein n=1 Tax=Trypanosoma conorhini TaxID=83891 RepID=A0A3R7M312_9TRYP|nr:putative mucin-like glycoprotein [Trypanosoma conorhini]RNE95223.1 putative mucin-like glycoprotein [Trypanosoma conorhini]